MEHSELLRRVVEALERAQLPYLVTGSTATIFYAEPRFTADIDVVVDLPADRLAALLDQFSADEFYVSPESARRAVARRGQFNIIHPRSGLKIDVIVAPGDAFDRSRFARSRRVHPAADYSARFASPEDVIVKKMAYYQQGGSEKHLRDIASMLAISGEEMDRAYVAHWAERLGLAGVWREIVARMGG